MLRSRKAWIAVSALILGSAVSGTASAQSTWNLYNGSSGGSGCSQNALNSGNFSNTWACTGVGTAGTSLTASAFSTQFGTSQTLNATPAGTYYANAYLSDWGTSGFGAANRNEGLSVSTPNHAIDNIPAGGWDGVLLNFGATAEVLSSVGIGWAANASGTTAPIDITVLRWTGSGAPTGTNSTVTAGTGANTTLNGAGWSLVGSYQGLTGDSSLPFGGTARSTGASAASSWWLITAFNSTLNGGTSCKTAAGAATTCDEGDDAFKLNYITTATAPGGGGGGSAPEPASLALVAVALLGATAVRRRAR